MHDFKSVSCYKEKGFSLLELMIALAIAGILAGMGVVSFISWTANTQSVDVSNTFRSSLSYARGQAIKHGGWVSFCGSDDGVSCSTSYQDGWLVFKDVDRDRSLSSADTILKWHEQEYNRVELKVSEGSSSTSPLVFNFRGYPDRELKFRAERGDYQQSYHLHPTGRIEKL